MTQMKRDYQGWLVVISSLCVLAGCTTMLNGNYQQISVKSTPEKAQVLIDGKSDGTATPGVLRLLRNREIVALRFEKEGYASQDVELYRELDDLFWANLVWLGFAPVGMSIDLLNGSAYHFTQNSVQVELQSLTSQESRTHQETSSTAVRPVPSTKLELQRVNASGPRIGATYLPQALRKKIKDELEAKMEEGDTVQELNPVITQIGWQFEKHYVTTEGGPVFAFVLVPLLGGLDQNFPIPSITALLGLRWDNGVEIELGPNLTPLGSAFAYAAGKTFHYGQINLPLNLAVVPAKDGTRVSLLTGFNWE